MSHELAMFGDGDGLIALLAEEVCGTGQNAFARVCCVSGQDFQLLDTD